MIERRAFIAALAAAAAAGAAAPASALTTNEAEAFVREMIDEMRAIVRNVTEDDLQTEQFLELFRERSAIPQIAQFTMGANWRRMSDAQKERFLEEFEKYAARAYAARALDFDPDQEIAFLSTTDAGKRGIVVRTRVPLPDQQPILVEWLVSERPGTTKLIDVIAEGVSVAISQREEFAAMVDRRGGDIDAFIAELSELQV